MSEAPRGEFNILPMERVVFGPGVAAERIAAEVEALGRRRAFIVTGRTLAFKTELVDRIRKALGDRCAGAYCETAAHVPRRCVREAARQAREAQADILVAIGGGSAVDNTKGMAMVLAEGEGFDDLRVRFQPPDRLEVPALEKPKLPIITITTTLSGAEFTDAMGITDETTRCKDIYRDRKLTPRVVFLDPEMTLATGPVLWASTGIKSMAGSVEALYSRKRQPFTDALALHSIKTMFHYLPASVGKPADLAARGMLQQAMFMALYGLTNVSSGVAAGLRHQVGARCNVPHGVAGSILLPHAMAFNRSATAERQALVAQASGINTQDMTDEEAAKAAADAIWELIRRMDIPSRLRDVGVREEDLGPIAAATMKDHTIQHNPRPITHQGQLLDILRAAW